MDYMLNDNVYLHIIKTNKFKTVTTYLNFYDNLSEKNHAIKAILSNLIGDKSINYPTKDKVSAYKDLLYGATFGASLSSYGQGNAFQVISRVLNSRFTNEDTLKDQFLMLHEFLYNPIINEETFAEAKYITESFIQRRLDKPMTYAITQAINIMGNNYPFSYSIRPSLKSVQDVCFDELSDYYNLMLHENRIDFYIIGDVDENLVVNYINEIFDFSDRKFDLKSSYIVKKDEISRIVESKKINQSCLVMIYETDILNGSDDYYKLKAANCLFGQVPSSLLFQEVREKRSLCYSIFSQVLSFEGLIFVATGIDGKNAEEVEKLIEIQRERIINDDFDEKLLKDCLALFGNSLDSSADDVRSVLEFEYTNIMLSENRNLDDVINKIVSVSKNEVQEIFKKLKLKTVYVLKEDQNGNN